MGAIGWCARWDVVASARSISPRMRFLAIGLRRQGLWAAPAATPAEAAEAEERFAREARLLASLAHPNLPKVHDYFSEQDESYLVMEFIDGRDARAARGARRRAKSEHVLASALEMCAALEYLHAQTRPVIFRDVAPDDIMVDNAGM